MDLERAHQIPQIPRGDLSGTDLSKIGTDSLKQHLVSSAYSAHVRYQAIQNENLYGYLSDPEYVRYPVRLLFEMGTMSPHQFGQYELDSTSVSPAYLIYLHPLLQNRSQAIRKAVAYFIPFINYGKLMTEDLAFYYGAALLGIPGIQFYEALCRIADSIGATTCLSGETHHTI